MPQDWIDKATTIRKGEELNLPELEAYLLESLPQASGTLVVEQFPGGASNLTYLLKLGNQQLVLRRPPFGTNVKTAHDMGREYKVLSALSQSYGKAPTPLLHCDDENIIGAPFYVMERVQGIILRSNKGRASELDENTIAGIARALTETMSELHTLDYKGIGLGELGKPEGYVERQVIGWTKRYFKSQTESIPEAEKAAKWLNDNLPTSKEASLIHNDFKHDNVVLDRNDLTKISAILDWEMCTLGDPLMDLGTTLAYWSNPEDPDFFKMNPSALPGNPTRDELMQMYAQSSGRDVSNMVFYFAYGLFKLAVILQQIYYRYKKGFTKDPRFAHMNVLVRSLCEMAVLAIEKGKIDRLY